MHRAVIGVGAGCTKRLFKRSLILECGRCASIIERHAVLHARLAVVRIAGAAVPRPSYGRSSGDGLRSRAESVVADRNPSDWRRCVDPLLAGRSCRPATAAPTQRSDCEIQKHPSGEERLLAQLVSEETLRMCAGRNKNTSPCWGRWTTAIAVSGGDASTTVTITLRREWSGWMILRRRVTAGSLSTTVSQRFALPAFLRLAGDILMPFLELDRISRTRLKLSRYAVFSSTATWDQSDRRGNLGDIDLRQLAETGAAAQPRLNCWRSSAALYSLFSRNSPSSTALRIS